jgi:D-arabinose 1-dehydrogenase-like Zn-dependent alcohol dehydrogenase
MVLPLELIMMPLEEVNDAFKRLEEREVFGKVVLKP